jgi:hypothetical protein
MADFFNVSFDCNEHQITHRLIRFTETKEKYEPSVHYGRAKIADSLKEYWLPEIPRKFRSDFSLVHEKLDLRVACSMRIWHRFSG